MISLITDMDKVAQLSDLFHYRAAAHVDSARVLKFVMALEWGIFQFRQFVIPGILTYGYSGLILAAPPEGMSLSAAFILDGLTILFIANIDGILAQAVLDEGSQTLIREAFASMEADPAAERRKDSRLHYLFHRVFAGAIGAIVIVELLAAEALMESMPIFRIDWEGLFSEGSFTIPGPRTCTNVGTMLAVAALIVAVFFSLQITAAHRVVTKCGPRRCLAILDVICTPLFVLIIMPGVSTLLMYTQYVGV